MKITVWSALSGKISGHLVMNVPKTQTIRKLLEIYCSRKGVSSNGYVMRSRDNLLLNPNKTLEQSNINDGETLTLGLADDEEQTLAFGSWGMVTAAALIMGSVGLAIAIWTFTKPITPIDKYGIVMDAGSSHSEIFVFTWDGEKPLDTADVKLVDKCFMAGGVSGFIGHVDDLNGYLGKCINQSKKTVPVLSHWETPFYVGATAGMRILRDFDPEGAMLILSALREVLMKETSFVVEHENIEIIEGSVEGTSGWTSVNYLLGHLKKEGDTTAAALDLGGASVQISSVKDDPGMLTYENLTLFKHSYQVVSVSYLCYGIGEAQHRYSYFLVHENETLENNEDFADPCLATGVTHNITSEELNGACTRTDDSEPILRGLSKVKWHKLKKFFKHYNLNENYEDSGEPIQNVGETTVASPSKDDEILSPTLFIHGSSNATLCDKNMRRLFDLELCKETFTYGDCMKAESAPVVTGDLVAVSSLFQSLIQILGMKPGTSLPEFKDLIYEVCNLDAEDLYKRFPGPKELIEEICFDAMYIYNLLTAGFGIDSTEWKRVQFINEINNTAVEWPMGFMMNRTTAFPADIPSVPMTIPIFVLLVLLFAAFLISGILFARHSIKIKKQSASYQRCGSHQA